MIVKPIISATNAAIELKGRDSLMAGVHGKPVELHLEKLWASNITLTTRLVDAGTTQMLLRMVQSGRLDAKQLVSHRFELSEIMKAYDIFANAAKEHALKVVFKNVNANK